MLYSLKHISGPSTEPVTLAELKQQASLDPSDTSQDELLTRYIRAARRDVENILGRKIGTQTWDVILDDWPTYVRWVLPIEPLIEIESIEYEDEDGLTAFVGGSIWGFNAARNVLWVKPSQTWPSVRLAPEGGVRVRVIVGMQPESDGGSPVTMQYPENIRHAILLRASTFYRLREDVTLGTTMTASEISVYASLLGMERNIPV